MRDSGDNQVIILGTDCVLKRLNEFIEARREHGTLWSGATRGKDGFHTLPPISLVLPHVPPEHHRCLQRHVA